MAFPLGFGLTTNSQRSDSPRYEAHLDIKLHIERALVASKDFRAVLVDAR